ncbi:AEC family transporter [Oharaeibacter diazotrophicus]|uniref:AEC family transporter n=1 Tax=Oharaeibacter diazotrophicus TaxID=1920512 RepID=UPI0013F62B3C
MTDILLDVLPVFLIIALGWAAVGSGFLKAELGDALGDFVFRIGVPVLLFRTVATADFSGGSPWGLWVAYFGGVAVTWTAGHLVATRFFASDARFGVIAGVSSAFANTVFVGLPLVIRLLDQKGVAALAILISVHLPVMMITGTLLMERAARRTEGRPPRPLKTVLAQVAGTLARNPLVIGILLGSAVRTLGVPLGGVVGATLDQIAATAGPTALLSIGMAVRRYGVRDNLGLAAVIAALKLVVLPATVFGLTRLVAIEPTWAAAMVLTAAVPTGVNAYLIANHFGVGHGLASSVITLTTLFGVVTVTVWAWVLGF